MTHEPSQYVQPEASELRINRLWSNVSEGLARRPARGWRWLALCGALGAAASGAWLLRSQGLPSGPAEQLARASAAKLETAAEPLAVTLLDGSKLSLASRSELAVQRNQPAAVSLSLTRGRVVLDVRPSPGAPSRCWRAMSR
jgi:ferric-dicitrate binding protein FerR (iron transport regulator)